MPKESLFLDRCFMTGDRCQKSGALNINPSQVFLAIQYSNTKNVSYAIEDAVRKSNLHFVQENLVAGNIMIPCKVCQDIQGSQFVIVDISNYNPNVFFELGIACAIGRTAKLISDGSSPVPSDLAGIEYLKYDPSDISQLSRELQTWLNLARSEQYQCDTYMRGHLFLVEQMSIVLDNYNGNGDTRTTYTIAVKKIAVGDSTADCFAMPYHDSVSVDVPEDFFALRAASLDDGASLNVRKVIFSSRLKRFGIVLEGMGCEDRRSFCVSMNERQLFDQEEAEDWYDFNILYPIQELTIDISINHGWSVSDVHLSYADTLNKVASELKELQFDHNRIRLLMERPLVGVTYMIRWKWESRTCNQN